MIHAKMPNRGTGKIENDFCLNLFTSVCVNWPASKDLIIELIKILIGPEGGEFYKTAGKFFKNPGQFGQNAGKFSKSLVIFPFSLMHCCF